MKERRNSEERERTRWIPERWILKPQMASITYSSLWMKWLTLEWDVHGVLRSGSIVAFARCVSDHQEVWCVRQVSGSTSHQWFCLNARCRRLAGQAWACRRHRNLCLNNTLIICTERFVWNDRSWLNPPHFNAMWVWCVKDFRSQRRSFVRSHLLRSCICYIKQIVRAVNWRTNFFNLEEKTQTISRDENIA